MRWGYTLLVGFFSLGLSAQDSTKAVETQIRGTLHKHELVQRVPYSAQRITIAADGSCVSGCERGGWARDGSMLFNNAHVRGPQLIVTGDRLLTYHDPAGKRIAVRLGHSVEIDIAISGGLSVDAASQALSRAFLPVNEPPPDAAPPDPNHPEGPFEENSATQEIRRKGSAEWQRNGEFPDAVIVGRFPDGSPAYLVTKPITPPKAIKTLDPEYSEADRKARRSGGATLRIAVDARGFVRDIQVLNASSKSFIEPSAIAVSQWEFRPASYNGIPVACVISVEMNFRLY